MSENNNTPEQVQENVQDSVQQQSFNPFSDSSWSAAPESSPATSQGGASSQNTQDEYEEEIIDADEWLKNQFGWENEESAKEEINQLRKLREEGASDAEIEFANEQSAKFFKMLQEGKEDEIYSFLENKKKFDRLSSITDLDSRSASEIIKLNMQQKYKDLSPSEIEYKFNKQFSVPQKPVQEDLETDEEYQERLQNWETKVKDVETEMFIEAKLAKPELEKLRNELVLPDVEFENSQGGLSQEELEAKQNLMSQFRDEALSVLDSFDSFNISVKDEEVEIPLSYSLSDEEKSTIASQIERFTESNFDANVLLAERWLREDKNGDFYIDTNQVIRDLTILQNEGKMNQKFVNDAASKRLAEYIKKTSNVSVNSQTAQSTFSGNNKSDLDRQIEYIWKNS